VVLLQCLRGVRARGRRIEGEVLSGPRLAQHEAQGRLGALLRGGHALQHPAQARRVLRQVAALAPCRRRSPNRMEKHVLCIFTWLQALHIR